MKYYYLWIVVLTPMMQDKIVATLINKKISVEALSNTGKMVYNDDVQNLSAYTVALKIGSSVPDHNMVSNMRRAISSFLDEKDIKSLGIVLSETGGCSWIGSTYTVPENIVPINAGPYRTSAKGTN